MKTIERYILSALIRDMSAQGYQPAAVYTENEYTLADEDAGIVEHYARGSEPSSISRPMADYEVFNAVDTVCRSTLHFTDKHANTFGDHGVLVILGNGQWARSAQRLPQHQRRAVLRDHRGHLRPTAQRPATVTFCERMPVRALH